MSKCVVCHATYEKGKECPHCGNTVQLVKGFPSYAENLMQSGEGFKVSHFSKLWDVESRNFWFISRNKLILHFLKKFVGHGQKNFLEIGCGTGFVLAGVASEFPEFQLMASDAFVEGLSFAAQRVPQASFLQMDARNIPFYDEFDVVGAFDVLEHIEDDVGVISEVYNSLHAAGMFIVTVPQHMWLWSRQDEVACHVRRYSPGELEKKLKQAGFSIEESVSFVRLLLPLMWFSRKMMKNSGSAGQNKKESEAPSMREFSMPAPANKLLTWVLTVERAAIKFGLRLPWGGSRLVVARKIA